MNIKEIQNFLNEGQLDSWLLYDFRGINAIAQSVAGLVGRNITRRWFCHIPAKGTPVWLIHQIERSYFDNVCGDVRTYMSWRELHDEMAAMLSDSQRIAMEYSPDGAIPYVSRVDGGTLEWIRSMGVEVVSSADLVQLIEARWTEAQYAGHQKSARLILEAKDLAFRWIGAQLRAGNQITEYDVQCFLMERFDAMDVVTGHPPIVAVNAHSGDPHYAPTATNHQKIEKGDFVLIDLWAKQRTPDAVYADTTWVGYAGETVPERYVEIFEIVREARDRAVAFIREKAAAGETVYGYAVDDVVRGYITERGYGEFFIHRTGHSIGTEIHGNGVNIDNLETKDGRALIPGVCFSIEPGIYLTDFGVRTEIDVFLARSGRDGVIVTTVPIQTEVLTLL
jgi:Xaa-Pro dipeptidase